VGRTPTRIGAYEVADELGRGAVGVVYRGRDPRSGAPVAIKVLLGADRDHVATARFEREVAAAAGLRHPGLVPVLDRGVDRGFPFLVMELVAGETLADRIVRGPLPSREAVRITEALAEALAHAHERGVLHRDVKPGNVLLDPEGRPRLTDFGLARMADSQRLTTTGTILGTPAYMAPEQVEGARSIDARADVYALGATLYEMLTGQRPFRAASRAALFRQVLLEPPQPPSELAPGTDPELERICLECLEKEPALRPDAKGVVRALRRRRRGGRRAPPPRPGRSRTALVASGVVLVSGAAAAGIVALGAGRDAGPAAASASPSPSGPTPATPDPTVEAPPLDPPPTPPPDPPTPAPTPTAPDPPPPPSPPPRDAEGARREAADAIALAFARRDRSRADALVGEARRADPEDPLWAMMSVYGDREAGLPHARRLLARGPTTALGCKGVAAHLIEVEGEPERALALLDRAWELAPDLMARDDNFFHFYGKAVRRGLEPEAQIPKLRWAIDHNRARSQLNRMWHFFYIGWALEDLDRLDEALATFEAALEARPDYGPCWLYLGQHLAEHTDQSERAVRTLRRALAVAEATLDHPRASPQLKGEAKAWRSGARAALAELGEE